MSNKKLIVLVVLALVVIFIVIIGIIRFTTPEDSWVCENGNWVAHGKPSDPAPATGCGTSITVNEIGMANPASVNCTEKGGKSVIKTKPNGDQYGLCYFDDNRACEEWSLLREECPVGGVKTTGFDTDAQKFCAWSGGQTSAVENAKCTFPNLKVCPVEDFYTGKCAMVELDY